MFYERWKMLRAAVQGSVEDFVQWEAEYELWALNNVYDWEAEEDF